MRSAAYRANLLKLGVMALLVLAACAAYLLVDVNPEFYRPAEVEFLWGNCEKAERELGWRRKVDFAGLVAMMMEADMKAICGMSCEEYKSREQ